MRKRQPNARTLAEGLTAGDRAALARAITLSESTLSSDRERVRELLGRVWSETGGALRVAVTGPPGVGKSTFVEAFGLSCVRAGERVAVLAVDPSSPLGGGAILGDKTRMTHLASEPSAFIRPSPSSGAAGGVALRTREAIAFAEAAGHGVVLVETVGAGQGELEVGRMTDVFLLLVSPGSGDELQGVKRGVMELADMVLVTKSDGELAASAQRTRAEYASALRLLRRRPSDPEGVPVALQVSAQEGQGIDEVRERVLALHRWRDRSGFLIARRRAQAAEWVRDSIEEEVLSRIGPRDAGGIPEAMANRILSGSLDPENAALEALRAMRG